MRVPFSYLERQFPSEVVEPIFEDLRMFIKTGDFTLGKPLQEFEKRFGDFIGTPYALGVNSGTDALLLSLKALGIGSGDEVITCAETFIATAGAIAGVGARPVFVDVNDEFTIDVDKIEGAITKKTKALLPVYFTGNCPDMPRILEIAKTYGLPVVEDSCCGIDAAIDGKKAGSWGIAGAFSFHPLKNLNVWSDGGMITTGSEKFARKISLLRNHGLINRDEVEIFGLNSRLDTFQAVVALRLLGDVKNITEKRIANAKKLDQAFVQLADYIEVPHRRANIRHVFHLYMVRAKNRDRLLQYCNEKGVEAKVHYPIPLPYQKCSGELGYKNGDFPKTERDCASVITFPAHQHLTDAEIDYMIETVRNFYTK
ncbi:MAG: hypothetical protein A3H42_06290 [Deltaproteobacteria bacterium RIFCSPLOWO2_02_FULL_46_8]|nr:MAG: hypothetical protein A3H42_06290 [Deltaproteobacteria bacterium RIFCSPLOWO2_02_FULL_46_8]